MGKSETDQYLDDMIGISYKRREGPKFQGISEKKQRDEPEDRIVMRCIKHWNKVYPALIRRLFMINNDAHYSHARAMINQTKGIRPGVADHCLKLARRGYHGAYIEFKAPKGRQTRDQKVFQQDCKEDGYYYALLDGKTEDHIVERFENFIKWYMGGEK